jgi:hypothetical protein
VSSSDMPPPGTAEVSGQADEPVSFDTSLAHPARTYNYWLGGRDNYEADRKVGDMVAGIMPDIRASAKANRAFLRRTVEYLAREAGIRQFLDIGTGLPTADNTHEVAQGVAPESRVVYVDNDPVVLAHARALLTSSPDGATSYIQADARDPRDILRQAGAMLDFSQPVAVMLVALLHFVPDEDRPGEIVAALMDAVPAGSYLVISSVTGDIDSDRMAKVTTDFNDAPIAQRITPRSQGDIAAWFSGLEFIEPGLVPITRWRPAVAPALDLPLYGGVGRKAR